MGWDHFVSCSSLNTYLETLSVTIEVVVEVVAFSASVVFTFGVLAVPRLASRLPLATLHQEIS